MKKNPFSLSFGKEPVSLINRNVQSYEIIDTFEDENPAYQVCMITGVRGSGKTVMLTEINKTFRAEEDWIVIDLSPERDLLQSFAANLSNYPSLSEVFREAKINLSFLGLGVEIEGVSPITDLNVAVTRMLEKIKKKHKRVLVTIDEAVCNDTMKEFVSLFQIYMRQDLPVFLLMTGLYENIYELQNEKTLTFLYRAPKIELRPLNIGMIAEKYKSIFELTDEEATEMAKETRGYPFAFQVLGYLCFKHNTGWHNVLPEFSQYLEEYVYEKIWSELSKSLFMEPEEISTSPDIKELDIVTLYVFYAIFSKNEDYVGNIRNVVLGMKLYVGQYSKLWRDYFDYFLQVIDSYQWKKELEINKKKDMILLYDCWANIPGKYRNTLLYVKNKIDDYINQI